MDVDSLKSAIIGSGGLSIQHMDFLPEIIRLSVGLITIMVSSLSRDHWSYT